MSQVRELTFTIDTLSDVDLSGVNTTLRHLSTKKRPVEPRHIVDFSAISRPDDRTVMLRVTLDEGIFVADTTSPRNGKNFITGHAPEIATVVMSNALDLNLNGTVKFDGAAVPSAQVTLDGQHVLKIDLATAFPSTYNAVGGHTIEVSGFADIEGNPQTQDEVIGYAVDPLASSIDTGDVIPYTANLKTGILRCSRLVMERGANIEEQLTRYLRQRGMDREHILHQSLVTAHKATLELYVLYLESVNPRLLKSFPNQGSTLSLSNPPTTYFFTFSAPLSLQCIQNNQAVLYDGTYVGDANVSLTPDEQTLVVDISGLAGANTAGLHSFELTDLCGVDGVNFTSVPTYIDVTVAEVPDADANAGSGSGNAFGTVDADGTNLVAVGADTLVLDGGNGFTVTGNAGTNTATLAVDTNITDHVADTSGNPHQISLEDARVQGDALTAQITIATPPSSPTHVATKGYVDSQIPTVPTADSDLSNDQYVTGVNGINGPGSVTIDPDDLNDTATTNKFVTAAEKTDISTAVQPSDNISVLTNDSGYVTTSGVTSVNGDSGPSVTLDPDDLDDALTAHKFVSQAEKNDIGTAVQPGDSVDFTSVTQGGTLVILEGDSRLTDARTPVAHTHSIGDIPSLDEDTMVSDSDQHVPTQQSVKAYVDTEIGAIPSAPVVDVNGQTGNVTIGIQELDETFLPVTGGTNIGKVLEWSGTAWVLGAEKVEVSDIGTTVLAPNGNGSQLTGITAGQVGADPAGTDNSTPVTLDTTNHNYLSLAAQEITLEPIDLAADVTGNLPYSSVSGTPTISTFGETLIDDADAAAARTTLGVDVAGTDNSTPVTLDTTNHDYLSLTGQEVALGPIDLTTDVTGQLPYSDVSGTPTISTYGETLIDDATAADARTTLGVDVAGTDNSTPVTLAGTPNYITISGQEITRNPVDLTTDVTNDLPIADGGTGASNAADARTNLGVDAAGTDNSTPVTLAGTPDYITISGQQITRNQIDLAADVTGLLPQAGVDGLVAELAEKDALITLSGVAAGDTDLGTFPQGAIISDGNTIKAALVELDEAMSGAIPVLFEVHNNSGAAIVKGTPVYVSGTHTSGKPTVAEADANGTGTNPAIGLVYDDIADGAEGSVALSGLLTNLDTSSYSAGAALYVSETAGDLTITRPTATNTKVQKVGLVTRVHATAGSILIIGAGRSNDINNELVTLTGVALNESDLGTFTGVTILDNRNIKQALQDLETETEQKIEAADVPTHETKLSKVGSNTYLAVSDHAITVSDVPASEVSGLATVGTSGAYSDLTGTPTLATVATSGSYNDLSNTPTIPADLDDLSDVAITTGTLSSVQVLKWDGSSAFVNTQLTYSDIASTPSLAAVATSGAYGDLSGTPTIPTQASLSVDDLIALSGVADGDTNLGTFTGATIDDNRNVKQALQDLETEVETKIDTAAIGSTVQAHSTNLDSINQDLATTDSPEFTGLTIDHGTATTPAITVTSTVDDSSAAPEFEFHRDSSSPADGDYLGQIKFAGENSSGGKKNYAKITGKISDVTATTEDGLIEYAVQKDGTLTIVARQTHDALKLINGTSLEVAGTATVTGNIITSGTVDGRDLVNDGDKLDAIEANAQVNVATNLTYTPATRLLESSTGSDVNLPEATTTVPGLMSAQDKTDLGNALVDGATVNLGTGSTLNSVNLVDENHTHTATDISDSTTVGRNVLTAATEGAARSDIGIGTGTEGTLDDGKYLKWNRSASKYDLAIMPDAETWGDITNSGTLTLNGSGDNSKLDIDISGTLSNGEVLKWDSSNGKFIVGPSEGGSTDAVEAQGFFFG